MANFGSEKLVTRGRVNVGQVLVALGDVERTEPLARETLEEGRAQGEPKFIHYSLHYLGDCALWRGQPQKAIGFYGESLRAALDDGNEMEAATEMEGMAMGLAGSGQDEKALRLHGASSARNKELHTTAEDQIAFWIELRERYLTPAQLLQNARKQKVGTWAGLEHWRALLSGQRAVAKTAPGFRTICWVRPKQLTFELSLT